MIGGAAIKDGLFKSDEVRGIMRPIMNAAGVGDKELAVLGDLDHVADVIARWGSHSVARRARPESALSFISMRTTETLHTRAGDTDVAWKAWSDEASHASHHGETQAIVEVLLRPGVTSYVAVSLGHPACNVCRGWLSVLGVVDDEAPIPTFLLPRRLPHNIPHSVYVGKLGEIDYEACDECGAHRAVPLDVTAEETDEPFRCSMLAGTSCATPAISYEEEIKAKRAKLDRSDFLEKIVTDAGWRAALASETSKPYFLGLAEFIEAASARRRISPPMDKICAALDATPPDEVKTVIIGEEPFPTPGDANGLAFSVAPGRRIPQTLENILDLLCKDVPTARVPSSTGDLMPWAGRGVLLLNCVLTIHRERKSHKDVGWQPFTDAVIKKVNESETGVVFILWGNEAQKKLKLIDMDKHRVITSSHPSNLSRAQGAEPFDESRCFSRANELLSELDRGGIDWSLE